MHSARWDHSVDLTGARIAVLGTGSTASQLLPELAKVAEKVYSVQRSATWILPKPDRAYTDRERWVFAHVPFAKKLYRTRLWLRSEANISVIENGSDKTEEFKALAVNMLETTVSDEELRRKLTPDHPLGCKRLVFSSDFLPALTKPNVEVVSSPARALRARSLVTADGTELDVDAVVCATGYAATDYLGQLDVVGEGGHSLRETWRDGAYAYLGMAVPGFPNFFMLYGPNTNVGSNSVIFMLEAQAHYIVRALKYMRRKGKSYVAVRPDTMAELHRQDRPLDGGHGVDDALQQLLPRRQRPGRHAVAAQRERLLDHHAQVQGEGLHLRSGIVGRETGEICGRVRPARPGAAAVGAGADGPVARTRSAPTRDSLNQRRRETALTVDVSGVDVVDDRRRAVPVRIYRGWPVAGARRRLLPFRRVRAGQPRHRSPPVR